MFQRLADTAVKTAVDTTKTLIIFLFPSTLNFIFKTEKRVLPRVFKHFCMFEKLTDTAIKTAVNS